MILLLNISSLKYLCTRSTGNTGRESPLENIHCLWVVQDTKQFHQLRPSRHKKAQHTSVPWELVMTLYLFPCFSPLFFSLHLFQVQSPNTLHLDRSKTNQEVSKKTVICDNNISS